VGQRQGSIANLSDNSDELWGSTTARNFLISWITVSCRRKTIPCF